MHCLSAAGPMLRHCLREQMVASPLWFYSGQKGMSRKPQRLWLFPPQVDSHANSPVLHILPFAAPCGRQGMGWLEALRINTPVLRSEERRVGKECRIGLVREQGKENDLYYC